MNRVVGRTIVLAHKELLRLYYSAMIFILVWLLSHVHIITEPPLLHVSIRKEHFSHPMLYSSFPVSFIDTSISPEHFSMTVSFIIFEVSFVMITS